MSSSETTRTTEETWQKYLKSAHDHEQARIAHEKALRSLKIVTVIGWILVAANVALMVYYNYKLHEIGALQDLLSVWSWAGR